MKLSLILSVSVLLATGATRANIDPTLSANPNPVKLPSDQKQGKTTLTWNTEGGNGFIWVSVDGGEETQLNEANDAAGTLEATVEVGKSYAFRLYTLDKEQLLAEVVVTVVTEQSPPANKPPGGQSPVGRRTDGHPIIKTVADGSEFKLICRCGPGLHIGRVGAGDIFRPLTYMSIDFSRGTQSAFPIGRNLQSGQCSPRDFVLAKGSPTQIQQTLLSDFLTGQVGRQKTYEKYLQDPNNYVFFTVYDTGDGSFWALDSDYGKPVKAVGRVKVAPPITATSPAPVNLKALATNGEAIANQDPLTVKLRNQQRDESSRRGFDIGMAAAEGQMLMGPGKERIRAALSPAEQIGFDVAVAFSFERNRNAELAATGAAIAQTDPIVAEARNADLNVFYWLGFDIATGIFGDPSLGASGHTAVGPGSLKIRNSLSAIGQRGFDASVKLHLSRNYKR